MAYDRLNPVQVQSSADQTGKNTGNLTAAFSVDKMPKVSAYEIYHMVVTGGPALAVAQINIGPRIWSYVTLDINGGNEWDPSQPALMSQDQELYFYWQLAANVTPVPVVTIWARYDPALPENRSAGL